jgi:hypothetical protein
MGTKTGAKKAYLAEAEPMKRLASITTAMKASISGAAGRPSPASHCPPVTASISPRPEWLKKAMNWAGEEGQHQVGPHGRAWSPTSWPPRRGRCGWCRRRRRRRARAEEAQGSSGTITPPSSAGSARRCRAAARRGPDRRQEGQHGSGASKRRSRGREPAVLRSPVGGLGGVGRRGDSPGPASAKRGSTSQRVTGPAARVSTRVEAIMNHQLAVTATW